MSKNKYGLKPSAKTQKMVDQILAIAKSMESWTDELLELREENRKLRWKNMLAMDLIVALQEEKTDQLIKERKSND